MIEPVHLGARLVVAADAHYTEVADQAVAVLADSAQVVRLTGDMAALVSRLDGRPVRDALRDLLAGWTPDEHRRVVEVLRRCKTLGLLRDAPPGAPPRPVDWSAAVEPARSITLRATIEPAPAPTGHMPTDHTPKGADPASTGHTATGAGHSSGDTSGGVRLVLARPSVDALGAAPGPEAHRRDDTDPATTGPVRLDRAPDGTVTVTSPDDAALPVTGVVLPPDTTAAGLLADRSGHSTRAAGPSEVFGVVVESVDPAGQRHDPAVIEACALLAETIPAEFSAAGP